jgi:hypothetical protein
MKRKTKKKNPPQVQISTDALEALRNRKRITGQSLHYLVTEAVRFYLESK